MLRILRAGFGTEMADPKAGQIFRFP